jgi:phage-related minor tail protein
VGGLLKKLFLLVCEEFWAHITKATKRALKELNTQLTVIIDAFNSQLQLFYILINKLFKAFMCGEWNKSPNQIMI